MESSKERCETEENMTAAAPVTESVGDKSQTKKTVSRAKSEHQESREDKVNDISSAPVTESVGDKSQTNKMVSRTKSEHQESREEKVSAISSAPVTESVGDKSQTNKMVSRTKSEHQESREDKVNDISSAPVTESVGDKSQTNKTVSRAKSEYQESREASGKFNSRTTLSKTRSVDISDADLIKLEVGEKLSQLSVLVHEFGLPAIRDAVKARLTHETAELSIQHSKTVVQLPRGQRWKVEGLSDESSIDITRWIAVARHGTERQGYQWDRKLEEGHVDWRDDIKRISNARNELAHMTGNYSEKNLKDLNKLLKDVEQALIRLGVPSSKLQTVRSQKPQSVFLRQQQGDFLITINTDFGPIPYMLRNGWKADPQLTDDMESLQTPVCHVVISHTQTTTCHTTEACCASVLNTQRIQMRERKFSDIAYNFLVGNDGIVYEGRGFIEKPWESQLWMGSSAYGWNRTSIGIAFIGIFGTDLPSDAALEVLERLLHYLVKVNLVRSDYILYALRQIRPFPDSPGDGVYHWLMTLPNWREYDGP